MSWKSRCCFCEPAIKLVGLINTMLSPIATAITTAIVPAASARLQQNRSLGVEKQLNADEMRTLVGAAGACQKSPKAFTRKDSDKV